MSLKDSLMESAFFFPCKNIFLADLLGIQHLFEILQTSLTFKYSENVAKSGCFKKRFAMESTLFFEMKDGYKVSCLKELIFC